MHHVHMWTSMCPTGNMCYILHHVHMWASMCPTGNMWYILPVKIFFLVGLRTLAYLVHGIFETEPNPVKQTKNKQKICMLCDIQPRGFSWLPQTHVHKHTQLKYLTFPTNITNLLLIFFSSCAHKLFSLVGLFINCTTQTGHVLS